MNIEAYEKAKVSARKAEQDAQDALMPYWDRLLSLGEDCPDCDGTGENGEDYCDACDGNGQADRVDWINSALLSIEDDGRMILAFGGPNVWLTADGTMCAAWWGPTIRCGPPTARHEDKFDELRELVTELQAC